MKQNVKPTDRAGEFIRGAIALAKNPNSAPEITHVLLTSMWDEIEADKDALRQWASKGMNSDVRRMLKSYASDTDEEGARQTQIDLFDPRVQHIVAEIDRERLFVPSRAEFVQLTPDDMPLSEMREAGGFLVGKGEDCIRRGRAVLRLADQLARLTE